MKVKYDLTVEEGRKDAMKKIATDGAVDGTVIGQPIISAAVCILGWIFKEPLGDLIMPMGSS